MSEKIKIEFPDGAIKQIDSGKTAEEIIREEIGEGLLQVALAVEINNEIKDLSTPLTNDSKFKVLTFKDKEGKEVFWHSSSHILALAVKRLFPNAKLTIGPAIKKGFYYDFKIDKALSEEDLQKIEQEAKKIIKEKLPFKRIEVSLEEAREKAKDEPYKLELINELENNNEKISFYYLGDEFIDLCRGPHVKHSGKIKTFKILKNSGAYWKGNSENKQLQRIYGISFSSKDEMKEYLTILEEAARRDHRKIGKELD